MRQGVADPLIVDTSDSDRNLDEFDSELGNPSAAVPRSIVPTAFNRLESQGAFVAATLAAVAVGYGGLLLMSWHEPVAPLPAPTVAPPPVSQAMAEPAPQVIPVVAVAASGDIVEARPRAAGMDATTLNAIWRRSDTRSLQQAFGRLRRETLAFHRCSMQMTATDRAVARCQGVVSRAPVRWTIDFQRTGNRWAIQRVTTKRH